MAHKKIQINLGHTILFVIILIIFILWIAEEKAKQSNLTVAVSFGLERDAAFEHAKTKTIISSPQPNGSVYVFGRDINVLWRHGILQMPPEKTREEGRISVIAWGWTDQIEAWEDILFATLLLIT